MQSIDLNDLIAFGEKAREIISGHPDYNFKICNNYAFISENEERVYCAHSKHFDVILSESWRIISEMNNKVENIQELLKIVWDSKLLSDQNISFKENLGISFNEFISLAKQQYFYFDGGKEQFLFPLFRIISNNGDVTGGFFHFLIEHFEKYNLLSSSSNDNTEYSPNDVLGVLIATSIWPDSIQKKDARNQVNDFISIRNRECKYYSKKNNNYEVRKFQAVLYYDSKSTLFLLTTFHRC